MGIFCPSQYDICHSPTAHQTVGGETWESKEGYRGRQSEYNSSSSWPLGMPIFKQDIIISEQYIENSESRILALTHSTPEPINIH